MNRRNILFTDGEGPIVANDFAFDVAALLTGAGFTPKFSGSELFKMLSIYDDYLVLQNRSGYRSGDTLSLMVPFLVCSRLDEDDFQKTAERAELVPGAPEYVKALLEHHWNIRIISTAYSQLWKSVGPRIGISPHHIASTELPLTHLRKHIESSALHKLVDRLLTGLSSADPKQAFELLDTFYWQDLPAMGIGVLGLIRCVGGTGKIDAAEKFLRQLGVDFTDIVYVGDSITDCAIMDKVRQSGGLSVAVNGSSFCLESASVAVTCRNVQSLLAILDSWRTGGRAEVESTILSDNQVHDDHVTYSRVHASDVAAFNRLVRMHAQSRLHMRAAAAEIR